MQKLKWVIKEIRDIQQRHVVTSQFEV